MVVKLSKEQSAALNSREEVEAVDPETGRVYVIIDKNLFRQECESNVHEAIQRGIDSMESGGGTPLAEADAQMREELGFPPRQ